MTGSKDQSQSASTILCKACGLCCTGHLFVWAKLKSTELKSAEALGLKVLGSDPKQRGFTQPCPLWERECTIYTLPQYPHFCRLYKCKLLKRVVDETTSLSDALTVVEEAKELIQELELILPVSSNKNFRERLVAHLEHGNADLEFQEKAQILLLFYKDHFGVKDLIDDLEAETDLS